MNSYTPASVYEAFIAATYIKSSYQESQAVAELRLGWRVVSDHFDAWWKTWEESGFSPEVKADGAHILIRMQELEGLIKQTREREMAESSEAMASVSPWRRQMRMLRKKKP